jgi:DNA-binding MarR family transcriptional regulator
MWGGGDRSAIGIALRGLTWAARCVQMHHMATPSSPPPKAPRNPSLSPANCTAMNLRMAGRAVSQYYDAMLAPAGITVNQFALLAALEAGGPTPMTQLADRVVTDRTTLTRTLRPLQRDGFVKIAAGDDRRRRVVDVTAKGRTTLAKARPLWERAQSKIVKELGQARWADLINKLQAAVEAVR